MRRNRGFIGSALLVAIIATSADSADPPAIANRYDAVIAGTPTPSNLAPALDAGGQPKTDPTKSTADSWQQRLDRMQEARRLKQHQEWQAIANRPTAWQMQNPSGTQNRSPTEVAPRGYVMSNTYTGPQNREWNNLSAPAMLPQIPTGYSRTTPVNFTNVSLAPNTYWGPANQSWSNVRTGTAIPNGLGGWNYVPGN